MPRLLVPVLSSLLLMMLAACETTTSGGAVADRPQAVAQPAPADPAVRAVQRCPHCGWIESKRKVEPVSAEAHRFLIYEYIVRMGDGSSRIFREELPVSWRVGERLLVIDGTDRLN
jgi:hypothetical protein